MGLEGISSRTVLFWAIDASGVRCSAWHVYGPVSFRVIFLMMIDPDCSGIVLYLSLFMSISPLKVQ